jgi:hypothetical protein
MIKPNIEKNIKIINYANEKYESIRRAQSSLMRTIGYNVIEYGPKDLSEEFKEKNKRILSNEIGAGYFIWKPYIILEEIKKSNSDDIIFYIDSGDIPNEHLGSFLSEHFKYFDYILYEGDRKNSAYTKPEVFEELKLGDEYKDVIQLEAGICGFKKTESNIKFLTEWLNLCENEKLVSDNRYNFQINNENFIEHRRDQSLLTILKLKHNMGAIPLYQRLYIDCNKEDLLRCLV